MPPPNTTYAFSFTAASLLPAESIRLANLLLTHGPEELEQLRRQRDLLNKSNSQTGKRQSSELLKRLNQLPKPLLEYLPDTDHQSQCYVLFLASCLAYRFIYDFMLEVIRPKTMVFDYDLLDSDYERFVQDKIHDHPEIEQITDKTRIRIKQQISTILAQTGMLQAAGHNWQIVHPILPDQLQQLILREEPAWLRLFLFSDYTIQQLVQV